METVWRLERKYVADKRWLWLASGWLKSAPVLLWKKYPRRRVNSLYWDTQGLDLLRENLNGVGERKKVRLRWYGETKRRVGVQLEVKKKRGEVVGKEIHRLRGVGVSELIDRNKVAGVVEEKKMQVMMQSLRPVLWVNYVRDYWESADGKLRVTVDDEVEYGKVGMSTVRHSGVIVELKYLKEVGGEAMGLAQGLELSRMRHSKYVVGMMGVG